MKMPGPVTIYHNPKCSNSRNALALIREAGIEPEIILYLETPPDASQLLALARQTGLDTRGLLRIKEVLATELGLDTPDLPDEVLIAHMVAHPVLINRPIVVSSRGARLCRPPETVRELLG